MSHRSSMPKGTPVVCHNLTSLTAKCAGQFHCMHKPGHAVIKRQLHL